MAAFTSTSAEVLLEQRLLPLKFPVIIHFSYTFYGLQVKLSVCNILYYTFLKITIFICADGKKAGSDPFHPGTLPAFQLSF